MLSFHQTLIRFLLVCWLFGLVLALHPHTPVPAEDIKYLISAGAALLLVGVALFMNLLSTPRTHGLGWLTGCALLFLLMHLAASVLAASQWFSLFHLQRWGVLWLIAVVAAQAAPEPRHAWRLLGAMVLAVAVSSLYGMIQYAGWDPFPWAARDMQEYRGLPASYGHPNFAGHVLVLGIIAALGLASLPGRRLFLLPAALMALHLHLTEMRGGLIALAAAGVVVLAAWGVQRLGRGSLRATTAALLLLLLLGCGIAVGAAKLHQQHRGTFLPVENSLVLRYNGYFGAAQIILDAPLLGHGTASFPLVSPPFRTDYEQAWLAKRGQQQGRAHNEYLEAGVEAGVPGTALYLALLMLGLLAALQCATTAGDPTRRRLGLTLAAAFTAFAVDGFFGFNLHVPVSAGLLFLLLGLTQGLWQPVQTSRLLRVCLHAVLLVAAAGALYIELRAFQAARHLQQAQGAMAHAEAAASPDGRRQILAQAYQLLESGAQLAPWDIRFPRALGVVARARTDFSAATAHFLHALDQAPHEPGTRMNLAELHFNQAESADTAGPREALLNTAKAMARELALENAYLAQAHVLLGRIALLRATDAPESAETLWREAAEHLENALRHGPGEAPEVMRMLGHSRTQLGEEEKALRVLVEAAWQDPSRTAVWEDLEIVSLRQDAHPVYLDTLNHALDHLQRQPGPRPETLAEVQVRLARLYTEVLGEPGLAALLLREAVAHQPQRLDAWAAFARAQPLLQRWDALAEAFATLDPDAALPPVLVEVRQIFTADAPRLRDAAAKLFDHSMLHRIQSGESTAPELGWIPGLLREALEHTTVPAPLRAEILSHAGGMYLDAQRWEDANGTLLRALDLAEEPAPVTLALRSEALAGLGRPQDGLLLAEEAYGLASQNILVRWMLARRLADNHRLAQANLEYLSLLTQLDPHVAAYAAIEAEQRAIARSLGHDEEENLP